MGHKLDHLAISDGLPAQEGLQPCQCIPERNINQHNFLGTTKKYKKAITHNVLSKSHTTAHTQCTIQVSGTMSLALQTYVTLSTTTMTKISALYTHVFPEAYL
jgi:hypothetical protein